MEGGPVSLPHACRRTAGCVLGAAALLAACAGATGPAMVQRHPDGTVLTHPPEAAPVAADFAEDTRDILPLRIAFPDWTLPPDYAGRVPVRAGQFLSNLIRHRHYPPPVSAWIAEKMFLAAALAADTGGRFGGVPGVEPLGPEPDADADAAYLAAFAAAARHYDLGSDGEVAVQADRFRRAWLAGLAGNGRDPAALERGIRRGERAAGVVIAALPRLDPAEVRMSPDDFRAAIAAEYPPAAPDPRQVWRFTPAAPGLERKPFNDYKPVAPGIGLVPPLPRLGRVEASVPPFPSYGSAAWWQALEMVAKYGRDASACRTPGQALTGWFFEASTSGPPAEAGNAVTSVIAYRALPADEAARVQFLVWSSMATAGILTWHEKYLNNVLRPVTAINDALPQVAALPAGWHWEPLGPTPPFPAYPSGHAAFTPAAYLTLAMVLAEQVPDPMRLRIIAASADPAGWSALVNPDGSSVALAFDSLGDLVSAANESRGYLGIHWEADGVWGRYLGALAALRTHQQLLPSRSNPTRGGLAFPRAPAGALEDPAYAPKADWLGTPRAWSDQFSAGLRRETGRDPASVIAFPELEGVALPWPNDCAAGPRG